MSYSISHWSGRLGNNIQQVANCIMAAEKNGGLFEQTLDHDIISKFSISFGPSRAGFSGRFYAWEPTIHCERGIKEGHNEIGIPVDYVQSNMRRVCKEYVAPHLNLPKKEPIGEDTIVMHLRSGDNYHRVFDPPTNYIPNPLAFYNPLIEEYEKCILITEPDKNNPIIHELEKVDKVQIQSSTVADDFATLMSAKNVTLSGVGTFAMAAALCSSEIEKLYGSDIFLTEHLNVSMMTGYPVEVFEFKLPRYIQNNPCGWRNTKEQRELLINYTQPEIFNPFND